MNEKKQKEEKMTMKEKRNNEDENIKDFMKFEEKERTGNDQNETKIGVDMARNFLSSQNYGTEAIGLVRNFRELFDPQNDFFKNPFQWSPNIRKSGQYNTVSTRWDIFLEYKMAIKGPRFYKGVKIKSSHSLLNYPTTLISKGVVIANFPGPYGRNSVQPYDLISNIGEVRTTNFMNDFVCWLPRETSTLNHITKNIGQTQKPQNDQVGIFSRNTHVKKKVYEKEVQQFLNGYLRLVE